MPHSFTIPAKYLNPWFNTGEKEALENLLSYFKDQEVTPIVEYLEDLISNISNVTNESIDDRVSNLLVEGVNIQITYVDGSDTLTINVLDSRRLQSWAVACSDRTTGILTGTSVGRFRVPYDFTVSGVMADLGTAQTSGSIFTVDINKNGSTILSTKLTIDNTEKTSLTAATAAVLSSTTLVAGDEITFDIDQVGDGTAKWLQVTVWGYQT